MNYELAKQLKDAGFPQSGWGNRIHPDGNFTDKNVPQPEPNTYYVPTLAELIEAYGDDFKSMDKEYDGWRATWWDGETECNGFGITAEEAVADLYLNLRGKYVIK